MWKSEKIVVAPHHLTEIWWENESCPENVLFYERIYLICVSCYVVEMLRLCFNGRSIISDYFDVRCPRRRQCHISKPCSTMLAREGESGAEKKNYDNINVYAANTFLRFAEWTKFVSSHITFYGALIRLIVTFTSVEKKFSAWAASACHPPSQCPVAKQQHTPYCHIS